MGSIARWIASGCGSGRFPWAPGTVGTLVGAALWWFLWGLSPVVYVFSVAALVAIGIWSANEASRVAGEEDPQWVVIDEVAGMVITMSGHPHTIGWLVAGFILFRLFDITKPGLIRKMETTYRGGGGIMADDMLAGVVANAVLWLIRWVI